LKDTVTPKVRLIASSNNWMEGAAVRQLEKTAALPGMRLAVGLPDLHPGKGSPIGAAFAVEGCLYPALVGNDIGCGIGVWRTGLGARKLKLDALSDRLRNLDSSWDGDAHQFLCARGIEPSGYEHSLGTIGGGNHFAELQAVDSIQGVELCEQLGITRDSVYLCVHSGSRGFGESILRDHVAQFGFGSLTLGTGHADQYFERHNHARSWASANRELIAFRVCDRLRTEGARLIDICHNYVEPREVGGRSCWIHRKGAAPSTAGPVLIPGSRGSFTYVVAPTEPREESAFSLAHGAGRKWSRSDCRARLEKRFSAGDLARTELGSRVICENKELLFEEAPQAYKNITIVIDDLVKAGLVTVAAVMKPLVTYKVRR
jgi:release factor H-coupled RctB family protein